MKLQEPKYQSAKQVRRRAQILEKAREIIGEKGLEKLTMRELAEASDVSTRTLYNIYGSREALIAHALDEFFILQREELGEIDDGIDPLEKILFIVRLDEKEIRRERDFSRAMMQMYFNTDPENPVFESQYQLTTASFEPLLAQMQSDGGLYGWADTHLVAQEIADRYACIVVLWLRDLISNDALFDRLAYSTLAIIASVATGDCSSTVVNKLKFFCDRLRSDRPKLAVIKA